MDASTVAASYRDALRYGVTVTLKRRNQTGVATPTMTSAAARARVRDYTPAELVGAVKQGDRKAIVLAEDLIKASFPVPPRRQDIVEIGGKTFNVEDVDDQTVAVGAILICYVLRIRG